MTRRIQEDRKMFRDVVGGSLRRELQKYITSGRLTRLRGNKKGKISIPLPQIDLPSFRFGRNNEGVGKGEGKPGDVVGRDPAPGQGDKAGNEEAEAMLVDVDMKDILDMLKDEWQLPNMLPKPTDTYEEERIKYTSESSIGPQSLLHRRKTLLRTMRRLAALGELEDDKTMVKMLDYQVPLRQLIPIRDDMRFRQWRTVKVPSSNAVIFFARDISGSMTPAKCEIVSDISWWLDCWIQQFYDKVERCYVVHDTRAKEVDEQSFYKMRHGGGTICSTALRFINDQLKNRYQPTRWNIYVFYFSDGDNWDMDNDNEKFINILQTDLKFPTINMFGYAQILPWNPQTTLQDEIITAIRAGRLDNKYNRVAGIRPRDTGKRNGGWPFGGWQIDEDLDEASRNEAIKGVIRDLLGSAPQFTDTAAV